MNRSMMFLLVSNIILFFMIIGLDFQYMTKFILWVIWASWVSAVSMSYTIIWRESVDCRCLEKEIDEEC